MVKYLLIACFALKGFISFGESGRHWYYYVDDNNVALSGYDLVSYQSQPKPIKGQEKHSIKIEGVDYWFESKANLKTFSKDPGKYLPAFGGWCSFFMGIDKEATGFPPTRMVPDPENFKIIAGKLHLFRKTSNQDFKESFEKSDAEAILKRGAAFWKTRQAFAAKVESLPVGMNPMARMEVLDWTPFMGTWETQVTWWNDTTGTSLSKFGGEWEFGFGYYGYAIQDNFKGIPDLPFAGTQNGPAIRGYDVQNAEWHMTYIPVNQPRAATWLMTGKFIGDGHLEGYLDSKDPYGNDILQKVTFKLIDEDTFEWQADWSWDKGTSWKEKTGFATVRRMK